MLSSSRSSSGHFFGLALLIRLRMIELFCSLLTPLFQKSRRGKRNAPLHRHSNDYATYCQLLTRPVLQYHHNPCRAVSNTEIVNFLPVKVEMATDIRYMYIPLALQQNSVHTSILYISIVLVTTAKRSTNLPSLYTSSRLLGNLHVYFRDSFRK